MSCPCQNKSTAPAPPTPPAIQEDDGTPAWADVRAYQGLAKAYQTLMEKDALITAEQTIQDLCRRLEAQELTIANLQNELALAQNIGPKIISVSQI